MKKRILATLMLVVFVVTSFAVMPAAAASFTDVTAGSKTEEAVTVLSKLGVINGYDDGTFKPLNNVTRAEFTAMLLRTRGMGSLGSTDVANPPFPDVTDPSVSWAIGNIRTARDMKIINGYEDGTFRPSNTVTYEEAIKMIVCALGYGEMGVDVPGTAWYGRYLTTATQLKFIDGAGGQLGVPATRETIAKMLYNCLEVKIAENNEISNKTILEADLGLIKNTGFIASNPEISLSATDANLRADEIQITAPDAYGNDETLTYKVDNMEEYADMLGAQITFYYKEDRGANTRTLIMANVEKSVTVELAADEIETDESTSSSIAYYASENATRLTTLSIAKDSIVVYNGQLYAATAEESSYEDYYDEMGDAALPLIGSVKLLDRDADKKYDIIFVDSYTAYIASSVTPSSKTIVDNNLRKGLKDNKNRITIDPEDNSKKVKIVDKTGKEVPFSTIKTGSVVCVKESNPLNGGEQVLTAVVCNETVSGAVKGVNSDETIKIDGKTYKFSAYAPWVNPIEDAEVTMSAPEMGDSGKFYLDFNGNIIGYDKNEVISNQQYGYLMSVDKAKDKTNVLEEVLVFRVMTQTGTKTAYYAYDKTKVNGKSFDSYDDMITALEGTANPSGESAYSEETVFNDNNVSQLIKFSTKNNKGQTVIDEIITAKEDDYVTDGTELEADKIFFYEKMAAGDSVKYYSTNKQLRGEENINIGNATIFKIPEDRSDVDKYKKMSITDFRHNDSYSVEFYDVSTTNAAKFVLVYGGAANAGEVNAESPVMVITEVSKDKDPEGNTRYKLIGYVGSSPVEYWGSTETQTSNGEEIVVNTLQAGDVVRLGTDDEGYYTVIEDHILFRVDEDYRDIAIEAEQEEDDKYAGEYPKELDGSTGSVAFKVFWGSVVGRDDTILNISNDVLAGDEEDGVEFEQLERSWFKNAKIYEFDTTEKELEITEYKTDENTDVIDSLEIFNEADVPSEVFIHMSSSRVVKTVIIVRR